MEIETEISLWLGLVHVFNATFNDISAISWWSVLLVEKTRVPEENHRPVTSYRCICHIMLYRVHLTMNGVRTDNIRGDSS